MVNFKKLTTKNGKLSYPHRVSQRKLVAFTLVELIVVIAIILVLSTISFLAYQSFSKDARDAKRMTDTRSLLDKVVIMEATGTDLSDLISPYDDGDNLKENSLTINSVSGQIGYQGKINFTNLKEAEKNFQDPKTGNNYPFAYAKGVAVNGEERTTYNFQQTAFVSEGDGRTKLVGNYFLHQDTDSPSLFTKDGTFGENIPSDYYLNDDENQIYDLGKEACMSGYTGENCEYKIVYGDETQETIAACNEWVKKAIGTQGGGYQNWLWVPARYFVNDGTKGGVSLRNKYYLRKLEYNGTKYVCNGFAVMKYEATLPDSYTTPGLDAAQKTRTCDDYETDDDEFCTTLAGDVESRATGTPIGTIRQSEAIHACTGINYDGINSHLLTNNERMAIARNIEQQIENWSTGIVGSGFIYNGHNDGSAKVLEASTDDTDGYYLTGDTATVGDGKYIYYKASYDESGGLASKGQKRTLAFSNGSIIRDLAGNIWEHVNKSNVPETSNDRNNNSGWNSSTIRPNVVCSNIETRSWRGYLVDTISEPEFEACVFTNGYTYNNIGPSITGLTAENGIGRIETRGLNDYSSTINNIFIRGADSSAGTSAGIFELTTSVSGTNKWSHVGFRCAL